MNSLKYFLKSLAITLSLATSTLTSVNQARAELGREEQKIARKLDESSENIERELKKRILEIEKRQKRLDQLAKWLDENVLPVFEDLQKKYTSGSYNPPERNRDLKWLQQLLEDLVKYKPEALLVMGQKEYDSFVAGIKILLEQIKNISEDFVVKKQEKILDTSENAAKEFLLELEGFFQKYTPYKSLLGTVKSTVSRPLDVMTLIGVENDLKTLREHIAYLKKYENKMEKILGKKKYTQILDLSLFLEKIISKIANFRKVQLL